MGALKFRKGSITLFPNGASFDTIVAEATAPCQPTPVSWPAPGSALSRGPRVNPRATQAMKSYSRADARVLGGPVPFRAGP